MEKGSEIKSAIEELSLMMKLRPKAPKDNDCVSDAEQEHLQIKPLLHVCNLIIQVLGWFPSLLLCFNSLFLIASSVVTLFPFMLSYFLFYCFSVSGR